jgi:hypothetical protein
MFPAELPQRLVFTSAQQGDKSVRITGRLKANSSEALLEAALAVQQANE